MPVTNIKSKWSSGDLLFKNAAGTTICTFANTGASLSNKRPVQYIDAAGAITITEGVVLINNGNAITVTLADPTTGTDDGKVLHIRSETAKAHLISNAAGSGFNGGGATKDVATLGAAIANGISVVAYLGVWWVLRRVNATLG
jgi:hypothetical protein